jgi:rhodanese-related sulfurtransferase
MYKDISQEEFRMIMGEGGIASDVVILDVRTEGETKSGVVKGALNIDISSPNFGEQIQYLDREKSYLVYCYSGARSSQACKFMEMNSFGDVYNLIGGMMAWNGELVAP